MGGKARTYPVRPKDAPEVFIEDEPSDEIEIETVTVEMEPVIGEVVEALHAFHRDNYRPAAWLLVGWRTYLRLEYQLRQRAVYAAANFGTGNDQLDVHGALVIVDDTVADLIKPLPAMRDIRVGGRDGT